MEKPDSRKVIECFVIPTLDEKVRLSDLSSDFFTTLNSRKGVKKAIKRGDVLINGQVGKTWDFITGGEKLELFDQQDIKPTVKLRVEVCYEDDYLAIVNKPAGIVVSGNKLTTLENSFPNVLMLSNQKDALSRPEPIHRLDFLTSGALLVGKTRKAVVELNNLFSDRMIKKRYMAITIGDLEGEGKVEMDVDSKSSLSEYKVLQYISSERFNKLNLTLLHPYTGRRHQLRKHMAYLGCPILGDVMYGKDDLILKGKGLYLHSYSLQFTHPFTGCECAVNVSLPKKFTRLFPEYV
jgi:23S rRNA pseudouridine1911/1915/1917 synthase